ncbi:MAG: translocation/assembly module TamB domain-containing protein [Acidobacteria bacterium]|nr:translocation/assembly module TamB domain-containing protein [Acidobacteriota bacterium]
MAAGAYRAGLADFSGVDGSAAFVAGNAGVELTGIRGEALGGTFAGSAAIKVTSVTRGRRHEHAVEERGTAALSFENLDVQRIESAFPHNREFQVHFRGRASGTVGAEWTGTPGNALAEVAMAITPPAATAPGEVPVRAAVRGTYNGRTGGVNLQQFEMSTPSSDVRANGTLQSRASLHVTVSTSNVPELRAALADVGIDVVLPADVHGRLSFVGDVLGTALDPQINGHVMATDFDYLQEFTARGLLMQPAPAPAAPIPVHWDRITADLQYSSRAVSLRNATLQDGSGRVALNGSAGLEAGHVVPQSAIDGQARIENESAEHLATLIGMHYRYGGLLSGSLRLAGTAGNPAGAGSLHLEKAAFGREPVSIAADFAIREHEILFTNLTAARGAAQISGAFSWNLLSSAFSFKLTGAVANVGAIPELQNPRVSVAGKLAFTAQGSGTPAAPDINGNVHITNLVLNGESVGDFDAEMASRAGTMHVTASTTAPTAQLSIRGDVQLRGDLPAELTIAFPRLDFDPLLRAYLRGRLTGHSLAAGVAQLSGPLRSPEKLLLTANVDQFSVSVEKLNLRNASPLRFRVSKQTLVVDQFHITGSDTDFTATGSAALNGTGALNLSANGTIDLALVQTLDPNFTSAGRVTVSLRAQGTMAHPLLGGQVDVASASVSYSDLPNGLSAVNGTLRFNQNRLVIEKLTGQSGGGALTLGGYIAYSSGFSFAITGRAEAMRLRYPPGVSSIANVDLRWTGTPAASTVTGEVLVTRFTVSPQFDFTTYLERSVRPISQLDVSSALSNIRLDVHVASAPALQVSTSLAKLSGDLDLRLRGTVADPAVLGRVNILRGTVFFNGTNYQLQRGDITFANPATIQPVLNLEFTTRIAGYDINLSLDGPVERLHTMYRSDPPLPTTDIISLLAFRQCPTSAEFTCSPSAIEQAENYNPSVNPSFSETASNQILGEALNATLSNRVQRLFGISRVKISPEIATVIGNPSARITVEQQVSNNVTITYVTDVAQATQQVIQVEYNVNRNISIVAIRDQFGVLSFDVRLRHRKR